MGNYGVVAMSAIKCIWLMMMVLKSVYTSGPISTVLHINQTLRVEKCAQIN